MHINAYTVYTSHTHTHTHTHTNTKQVYNVTVKAATHGLNNNTHTYIHHTGPHTHTTTSSCTPSSIHQMKTLRALLKMTLAIQDIYYDWSDRHMHTHT